MKTLLFLAICLGSLSTCWLSELTGEERRDADRIIELERDVQILESKLATKLHELKEKADIDKNEISPVED